MANRLNVVIGADINELKKGFDEAIKVVQSSGTKMSGSIAEAAKDIQSRLDALASKRPTARVVRELQTLAMEARSMGPDFAAMADQFVMAAGKMQDEIGDTRAQIGYFASDTRRLDAVLGGAQAIAAGFGVVQGSMAAMGIESEDLQKTMAKLQGVMVLLNSLQTIQNALQAESTLRVGLQTAATKVQTYVMGQATVAARVYAASLATLGIGAVILLLGGLASSLMDVKTETKSTSKEMDDLFDKQKKNAQDAASLQKTFNDVELKSKITAAKRAGASEKELRDIEIKFLNEKIKKQTELRNTYKANSLERIAIGTAIAEMEVRKEDLITENIVEANKKREEEEKKAAEKRKKIAAEEAAQKIRSIYQLAAIQTASQINGKGLQGGNPLMEDAIKQQKFAGEYLQKHPITLPVKADFSSFQTDFVKQMYDATQEINKQFEQMLESITTSFGEALGNMLSGQDGAFQNFGKQALATIAEFMKMVGQALIATAIASDAFKKLLLTQPLAAAAAGVALVAGATIIKNKLEKGPEFTAFADGGIVSGPTFALMGEYPNARTNPEVIAPLDKLQKLIGTSSQGSGDSFIASTRISGRDLSIVLERYKQDNSRG